MKGLSPAEFRNLILSVGTESAYRILSPAEVAGLLAKAKGAGNPTSEIARALHLEGATMIGRFLSLNKLDPTVAALVQWGKTPAALSFSVAVEIARLPLREQPLAARAAIEQSMNRIEAKSLVQTYERAHKPLAQCIDDVVGTRKITTTRYVFIGGLKDRSLSKRLESLLQSQRDDLAALVFGGLLPGLQEDFSVSLSTEGFTLVTDRPLPGLLETFPDFERTVSEALGDELVTRG